LCDLHAPSRALEIPTPRGTVDASTTVMDRPLWQILIPPWAVDMLLVLGAAAALLEGFWLGLRPPFASVSEVMMIAMSTGALALVFRREFGGEPDRGGLL
jgi:hypothetical protein